MDKARQADAICMYLFTTRLTETQCVAINGSQMLELAAARRACSKVTRAVRVAALSGWTIAIFAGIIFFTDISNTNGTWMGLLMTMAAFVEFRARERLRRLETSAARTLGFNQIVLGLLVLLYAGWNIRGQIIASPQLMNLQFLLDGLRNYSPGNVRFGREFDVLLYGSMAILALLTQSIAAWYCFSREKWIREYVSFAPRWIVQLQQAGVSFQ